MSKYAVYLCGEPRPCPTDPQYIHESMMGPICVPHNFSLTTGRARGFRQRQINGLYRWPGGCQAACDGLLALLGFEAPQDRWRDAGRTKKIVLQMDQEKR